MSVAHHLAMIAAYSRDLTIASKNPDVPEVGLMFKTSKERDNFIYELKGSNEYKSLLPWPDTVIHPKDEGFWIGGVLFRFFSEEEVK